MDSRLQVSNDTPSEFYRSIILIVDDTPVGRQTLESLLISENYELIFADSGESALAQTARYKPDLILLDVMMPGMDGFEVCRRLRADAEFADIPVLLVTALDDRQSKLRGIEAGADDFITKPLDRAEMRARVRTITRLNRYRRMVDERTRFAWVVEQSENGYLLVDDNDDIHYANASARRMLNLSAQSDLSCVKFLNVAKLSYRCEPEINWQGWPVRQQARNNLLPEGASPDTLYLIRPESTSASASWLQVTILRQPGVQATHLVRINDATAQMINRRDMFTFHSLVMHKLNTPLHLMLASMELLRSELLESDASEQTAELVDLAFNGAMRLRGVVDDILRFITVPSLTDYTQHYPVKHLPQLIEQIAQELELPAVTFQSHLPDSVRIVWSERVVDTVMTELLRNAKKFHPTGSPQVSVTIAPATNGTNPHPTLNYVKIQVADNGSSLTPSQIAQVWSPYYQAERYFTGEIPGMGLGLAVVASLVWEVNGTYQIFNQENGPGVVVELVIPQVEKP
ncbi:MAG: response regulator [Caldilineaceae bacterium]